MKRSRADLVRRAGEYAAERGAPVATIIKEVLHHEILHALTESGAAASLTFQGGTALRLCYGGTRYSEDLDFVGPEGVDRATMEKFVGRLQQAMADAYGLAVEVDDKSSPHEGSAVNVDRWRARIRIPDPNPSNPQSHVINIEVADVPSYAPQLVTVRSPYVHLPDPIRNLILVAETPEEILADKVVAVSARPYLKARDLWDLKFLKDMRLEVNLDWVRAKFKDYQLDPEVQLQRLAERITEIGTQEALAAFRKEMGRFVDARVADQLRRDVIARSILRDAVTMLERAEEDLRQSLGIPKPS